jgi:hypothetical protein
MTGELAVGILLAVGLVVVVITFFISLFEPLFNRFLELWGG